MDQYEIYLERYLEIESILNEVFRRTDYCLKFCILSAADNMHPTPGCCRDRYYQKYDIDHPTFELLKTRREILYGAPENTKWVKRISPCEYHTLSGCILKTHKSPICLSFFCRDGIDFLREKNGIYTYDYLGINYALEWILTGDLSGKAYEDFRADCISMVEKLSSLSVKCHRKKSSEICRKIRPDDQHVVI